MTALPEYLPPDSAVVNSGKKPCRLANVVSLDGLSMTLTRSHEAVLFGLLAQTPRSEPPAKAGAGLGPFWLGIGNDAQSDWYFVLTASSDDSAHGPSMYMSRVPLAKSSSEPPEVAPGAPSSVSPMYLDGETFSVSSRSEENLMPASDCGVFSSATHLPPFWTATWPPAPQMKLTIALV